MGSYQRILEVDRSPSHNLLATSSTVIDASATRFPVLLRVRQPKTYSPIELIPANDRQIHSNRKANMCHLRFSKLTLAPSIDGWHDDSTEGVCNRLLVPHRQMTNHSMTAQHILNRRHGKQLNVRTGGPLSLSAHIKEKVFIQDISKLPHAQHRTTEVL